MAVAIIERSTLLKLLPHDGAMCLLEAVSAWDETCISCTATSHRNKDNPLWEEGVLPVEAGIEYAAQAMAIHATLSAAKNADSVAEGADSLVERAGPDPEQAQRKAKPQIGYLATLSQVTWSVDSLQDLGAELRIRAERQVVIDAGSQYHFSIMATGETVLSGTALVALA